MTTVCEVRDAQKTNGLANILAIGTTNPPNVIYQSEFPDYYFRVSNREHMTDLKTKFKRICEGTMIEKRHTHIVEDMVKENPHLCDYNAFSLDTRQALLADVIPKYGKEAAMKAIQEWGQPKSNITHLIFCTTSVFDMPGPDYHLARLLNLNPSVKRYTFCLQGCHAGAAALRMAKDLAENNPGARVLVVCSEIMVVGARGPTETNLSSMIAQSLFADGTGAILVGAHPDEPSGERTLFELVSTSQTIVPNSEGAIECHLREAGLDVQLLPNVPDVISNNIQRSLLESFTPLGIHDWNSIFWIAHPGGPAILAQIEAKLGLNKSKLSTSWHVLKEYGNMSSTTVFFIMDEMRKRSTKDRKATTGDGFDYGVLFGFGPGVTIETIVLRSFPLNY